MAQETINFPDQFPDKANPDYRDVVLGYDSQSGNPISVRLETLQANSATNILGVAHPSDSPTGDELNGQGYDVSNTSGASQTFTNFLDANGDPIVVADGKSGVIRKSGGSWEFVETPGPDTSGLMESGGFLGTGADLNENKLDTAVFNEYEPYINTSIIEEFYDRPDKDYYSVIVDQHNAIIKISSNSDPDLAANLEYDRPDKDTVYVDKDNYILSSQNAGFPAQEDSEKPVKDFYEPPLQPAYSVDADDILTDYSALISAWDAVKSSVVQNPALPTYLTKTQIGTTNYGNKPIWCFRATPPNAKQRILLMAGTHAVEKMYIKELYEFFKLLMTNWTSDPILEWFRWNVDFHFIPCHCPSAMIDNKLHAGSRVVRETANIPCTWTKSGTIVTITYDTANFPENTTYDPSSYFNNPNIVGKVAVTFYNTSDSSALKNSPFLVNSIVNGNTITVDTGTTDGSASGTCEMCIWTDPNRNWGSDDNAVWNAAASSSAATIADDNGHVFAYYENKGTNPQSLSENKAIVDYMDVFQIKKAIDLHCPSANNYITWNLGMETDALLDMYGNIKRYIGSFNADNFDKSGSEHTTTPYASVYFATIYNSTLLTLEWGEASLLSASAETATNGLRWFLLVLTQFLKLKN